MAGGKMTAANATSPLRVTIVFGTRPEAIKLAPVARALSARAAQGDRVELRVVSTGQHADLLDDATGAFALKPDVDLGVMHADQDLYDVGIGCLTGLRDEVRAWRPDIVLVEGDTASVFHAALVAFYERIPVGHVEAGLRSLQKWAPYPEEMFRRLTDVLSDLYFAPTPGAREHLLRENVPAQAIFVTGNTVVDAVQAMAQAPAPIENRELAQRLQAGRRIVLLTVHRREVFGERIRAIFRAIARLADAHPDVAFLYPVHPNPNVRGPAHEILSGRTNVHLLEPLGYTDLIRTLQAATLVLTDSGGIQEEAPSVGVPVLVLRDVTERPEGVEAGVARLVGTEGERIFREADQLLRDKAAPRRRGGVKQPYGDGRAAERIADIVLHKLRGLPRRTEDWK
jgi:UDP-N-acetylglucosamine 2-epimerase (non-hydrolysing)